MTPTRTDTLIREDIENQIAADARIFNSEVNVTVDKGVVTLTGNVPSYRAKTAAGDAARVVPGVIDVINNIMVQYESKERTVPSDSEITTNVESSLAWDSDIDATDITVTVLDGVVTLEGTIDSIWRKEIAGDIVWNHFGVVDVVNNLTVVPSVDIVNVDTAKSIEENLDRNLNVDASNVNVEVENGTAVLDGTVEGFAAWQAARDAAFYTSGVIAVEDNLTIE
ncbi:BON domain-containing protein [Gracilimonas sp. Q87]|uniref:BON domain-containing protein n=1 Tax=Gracilimonas sp. Q87 TaxID=3384766 RepID=UPI0039842C36